MARIRVAGSRLVVRLNLLEKLMALRRNVRVPLAAVEAVEVQDRPLRSAPATEVTMGFAATSAPGAGLATVGPRATYADGRALLVVWLNRRSVVVRLAPNESRFRLLIVSDSHADGTADLIRHAVRRA